MFDSSLAAALTAKKYDQVLKVAETLNQIELTQVIRVAKKDKEFLCLAQNAYFEARGEPNIGIAAVSEVVIERTKNPAYPSSICQVVKQSKVVRGRKICQFSWYCEGKKMPSLSQKEVQKNKEWQRSLLISYMTYKDKMPNVTNGATHYFAHKKVNPKWKLSMVMDRKISNHTFFIQNRYASQ